MGLCAGGVLILLRLCLFLLIESHMGGLSRPFWVLIFPSQGSCVFRSDRLVNVFIFCDLLRWSDSLGSSELMVLNSRCKGTVGR